jgi:hypothetical protein
VGEGRAAPIAHDGGRTEGRDAVSVVEVSWSAQEGVVVVVAQANPQNLDVELECGCRDPQGNMRDLRPGGATLGRAVAWPRHLAEGESR